MPDRGHNPGVENAIELMQQAKVAVIGDVMLDSIVAGAVSRVCQDAPAQVFLQDQTRTALGGAAAVASLCREFGAKVSLLGVVGSDLDGDRLLKLAASEGIEITGIVTDPARKTTHKTRYLHGDTTVVRIDAEDSLSISKSIAVELLKTFDMIHSEIDVVLFADYDKGVCHPGLTIGTIDRCKAFGIPVIVDPPKSGSIDKYRRATVIKPNRFELESITGMKIHDMADAERAAKTAANQFGIEFVAATLDQDGILAVSKTERCCQLASRANDTVDTTGAGDTVLAVLGCTMAKSLPIQTACVSANIAAGIQVGRPGVHKISINRLMAQVSTASSRSKHLSTAELGNVLNDYRMQGKRIVMTNGCFDLLHVGHVTSLEQAKQLGDLLVVAVNSDSSIARLKGPNRPIITMSDRVRMLSALESVDFVVVFNDDTAASTVARVAPDIYVKGGTTPSDSVVEANAVTASGGIVRFTEEVEGISTTAIISKILKTRRSTSDNPRSQHENGM